MDNRNADDEPAERIAILGGGPAALAVAFELSEPDLPKRYDITLYQLGWRLGGKCASGRNCAIQSRIQEHGLHVFLGSYDNTFDILRRVYAELGRSPDQPLATWRDAMHGIDYVGMMEESDGEWQPWIICLPQMPGPRETHKRADISKPFQDYCAGWGKKSRAMMQI